MKTASAKAKGRNLQKYVVAKILEYFPILEPDDCLSRSMGASGEDIMLSPRARMYLPISIECKSRAAIALYKDYQQATDNAKVFHPILVVKQNKSQPLVVMDLNYFLEVLSELKIQN